MAATGTPTPNIGLRIPQGTDPASVDDINYNSNLLDTKLGAVGNDSVQDQIDDLNSKLTNCKLKSFTMDCKTTATLGNVGYSGELALSSSDIESARLVVPQFARKSGYNYPIVVSYEGNVLRTWSPVAVEGVSVGVVLFFF